MAELLKVNNLSFSYPGQSELIFKDFNLHLQAGQTLFIKGSSGVGKTTLLNLLSGLILPQQGDVKIEGISFSDLTDTQRAQMRAKKLGVIYQDFSLLPYLNVKQNIFLPYYLTQSVVTDQLLKQYHELMHNFGLAELEERSVEALSRGQKQRVAVIRALMQNPLCLLADEPTSALDPQHAEKLIDQMLDYCHQSGCALVFVSHDWTYEKRFQQSLTLQVQAVE